MVFILILNCTNLDLLINEKNIWRMTQLSVTRKKMLELLLLHE